MHLRVDGEEQTSSVTMTVPDVLQQQYNTIQRAASDQPTHLESLFPADPKASPGQETTHSLASHMVNPPFSM